MEPSKHVRQQLLFYPNTQPFYDVMQKEIGNVELVEGVNFDYTDSIKNNCLYLTNTC